MIRTTREINNFRYIYRCHMSILSFLNVQHNTLGAGLKVETQLCSSLKILAISVVSCNSIILYQHNKQEYTSVLILPN